MMTIKRTLGQIACLLLITSMCLAEPTDRPASAERISDNQQTSLGPRAKPPKTPTGALILPSQATGRIIIKFNDEVQARVLTSSRIQSLTRSPLVNAQEIIDRYGLRVRSAFNQSQVVLDRVQERAARLSGRAQPDLGGMLILEGAQGNLLEVGKLLNELDTVEWIVFEAKKSVGENEDDTRGSGACCIESTGGGSAACTEGLTAVECAEADGVYQGDGSSCQFGNPTRGECRACCFGEEWDECEVMTYDRCDTMPVPFPPPPTDDFFDETATTCDDADCTYDCGSSLAFLSDCYTLGTDPYNWAYCQDEECCETVCEYYADCCDPDSPTFGVWDQYCVALANMHCDNPPGGSGPCYTPLSGDCFTSHVGPGCNDTACCVLVCALPATAYCCTDDWDGVCVQAALDGCSTIPSGGATPDLEDHQGYLTLGPWNPIPPAMVPYIPIIGFIFDGYTGEGYYLEDPTDPYGGLYGLGQELLEVYGVDALGQGNLTRGRTIKVAVIEWACYPNHEDYNVTVEPGQTMILIPEITDPDHATSCLGIIGALDDGKGVTGIAPEAELHFFPITSVEEGPREQTAWLNAIDTLDPGDVISCSYGPGDPYWNLNNEQDTWMLIRLASDSYITCCVSAGNECEDLGQAEALEDSGGMVVGACSPGYPWYRASFSNYAVDPDPDQSNIVHICGWGRNVATTGGIDLWRGNNGTNRNYRINFSGTSAAAPQIAGLVACFQGLAKQFYGQPIHPEVLRSAMAAYCDYDPFAPPPFGGFDKGIGDQCSLDMNEDLGPFCVGPFPDVAGNFNSIASEILNEQFMGFDGSPLIDEIQILRGTHIFGSRFSIKRSENQYYTLESLYTERGQSPGGGGGPGGGTGGVSGPAAEARYLATGQITDILVTAHTVDPIVNSMRVTIETTYPGQYSLLITELYNWNTGRWVFIDIGTLFEAPPAGEDLLFLHDAANASGYVRSGDNRVLIRNWTYGLGGGGNQGGIGGQTSAPYEFRYDWINLETSDEWIFPDPG